MEHFDVHRSHDASHQSTDPGTYLQQEQREGGKVSDLQNTEIKKPDKEREVSM